MTKNIDYGFGEIEEKIEVDRKDIRQNLRIVKCCANCELFYHDNRKQKCGYCTFPAPGLRRSGIGHRYGDNYDQEKMDENWLKAYSTNVCDLHKFKSKSRSFGRPSRWVGRVFTFDGFLLDEDD